MNKFLIGSMAAAVFVIGSSLQVRYAEASLLTNVLDKVQISKINPRNNPNPPEPPEPPAPPAATTTPPVATTTPPVATTTPPVATTTPPTPPPSVSATTSITSYTNFNPVCSALVIGNQNVASTAVSYPQWANWSSGCTTITHDRPMLFSATQEKNGSHSGAANNIPNAVAYMGDFNYPVDFGKLINYVFTSGGSVPLLTMSYDSVNTKGTNVTGCAYQDGNLFYGLNDMSLTPTTLDQNIVIEFDIRVTTSQVGGMSGFKGYSGHKMSIGGLVTWTEAASTRTNQNHFFSTVLDVTPKYEDSLHRVDQPLCHDMTYETCWYDANGKYAEGRDIMYNGNVSPSITLTPNKWVHVRIPLTALVKKLGWVSPPTSWSTAKLGALIFGLESTGATRYSLDIKNYQVYTANANVSTAVATPTLLAAAVEAVQSLPYIDIQRASSWLRSLLGL